MLKKHTAAVRWILAIAIFMVVYPSISFSDVKIIKFGTLAPEGSTWLEEWKKIASDMGKRLGTVKFQTYGGGVLGDEPDMLRLMKLGQLHMGGFTVLGLMRAIPELSVLELPFLFENYNEIDYIREKMLPVFQEYAKKRGFVILSLLDQGFIKMYSQKPIKTIEELRKVRLWAWAGEEIATKTFELWGLTPIPLPVPDVLMGLQSGLIDTIYTTPLACVTLQWFTKINYIIDIPIRYEPGGIIGTIKYWNMLTDKERELTIEANKTHLPRVLKSIREDQQKALQEMIKRGIKVIKFKPEELAKLKKQARQLWWDLADKLYPRTLLEEILKNLEEYRRGKKR